MNYETLRAHTQAIEILRQKEIIKTVFEDMEIVWKRLYTTEGKCPIIEQVGTNVKRLLVRNYTIQFIKKIRGCIGLDLITKISDPDIGFWYVDDIVKFISDNETKNHEDMFKTLFNSVFGLSLDILIFTFKEECVRNDLYDLLKGYYDLDVKDIDLDETIDPVVFESVLKASIENSVESLFVVNSYL